MIRRPLFDVLREKGLEGAERKRALEQGKVFLQGVPTADGARLVVPDEVTVRMDAPRLTVGRDLAVIYKDQWLAVLWKPSGLLSVPAPRAGGHRSAVAWAGRILGQALAVHRLDEDTSGLLLVARDERTQLALKELFERHDIERRYEAVVAGHFPRNISRHRSILQRDRGDGMRGTHDDPDQAGKEAITHFSILEVAGRCTRIEARLETGRTHQVRIHTSELGHPIMGDPLYSTPTIARAAPRLALHAAGLGFKHPRSGETVRFNAPWPDDLEAWWRDLRHPRRDRTRRSR